MDKKRTFFNGVAAKLSVLMGGAMAVTGAQGAVPVVKPQIDANSYIVEASGMSKPLTAKLTLKQQKSGFKMIAQHDSHSSHSSHASHSSHSSHSSRAV